MISLQDQTYYIPKLPKHLRNISPQGIHKSEGYKGTLISNFHYKHDSYVELNLNKDNKFWYKDEHVNRVFINYDQKDNLPTH